MYILIYHGGTLYKHAIGGIHIRDCEKCRMLVACILLLYVLY